MDDNITDKNIRQKRDKKIKAENELKNVNIVSDKNAVSDTNMGQEGLLGGESAVGEGLGQSGVLHRNKSAAVMSHSVNSQVYMYICIFLINMYIYVNKFLPIA